MEKTLIYDLTTEYSVNPIDVFTSSPRFGWKIRGNDGYRQYSYRILVSSSEKNLENGIYDLWDSETVISAISNNVEYCGKTLESRSRGFWKCVITGENGETVLSDVAYFELTLLSEHDWKGRYISMPARSSGDAQYIRYQFVLPEKQIARGRVYMSGLGYSELYCNGKKVDDRELSPSYTDYAKRVSFVTYNISSFLTVGGNCLGVILGYGWFGDRKLRADLYIEFTDGTVFEAATKHSMEWLVSSGPIKSNSIYDGEIYDAREEEFIKGWNTYGFYSYYDNGWGFCINCPAPVGKSQADRLEPIKIVNEYKAVLLSQKNKTYLFDVSTNIAGWAKITVKGKRGTAFIIRYAERLEKDDGSIKTLNLRTAKATDKYICRGDGEEIYQPRFTYHGFQYVEIAVEGEGEVVEVYGCFVGASVKNISEFDSSSEILNRLHKNTLITEQGNLHGIMTDCPQRDERYGWLNDLTPRTFEQMNNFNLAKYYDKVLRDISDTVCDGKIGDTAPYNIGSCPADPTCAFLLLALRAYRRYGDIRSLEENYDNMKGWVDFLYGESVDGILSFSHYGDWVQPYENSCDTSATTPKTFVSTCFLFWQLKLITEIARILKKKNDENFYSAIEEKERKIINSKFFDSAKLGYSSCSQTANALALSLGICEEKYSQILAKKINDDIVARGYHLTCGNQGYRHVLYVLSDFGYVETLFKTVVNPEYPGWGYALTQGATSIWERWEDDVGLDMVSFNHPMFSAVDGWLINKIVGVDVSDDAVAANKLTIKPVLIDDLNYIYGSIETINGKATLKWSRNDSEIVYEITIPTNVEAKIEIAGNVTSIQGNIVELTAKRDIHVYSCFGGKYIFTVQK